MSVVLEIREKLEQLLKAWEGDLAQLDSCVDEEPYAYFSTFGIGYTKGDLVRWFSMRGKPAALSLRIINDAVQVKEDHAVQFANVIGIFKDNAVYQKHLAFGGTFVNKLEQTEQGWILREIRFDLRCEDSVGRTSLSKQGMLYRETGFGQPAFISGWKKIDDRVGHNMSAIPGMGDRMISPTYDTPWYVIPESDYIPDDETQIKELLYKYCYGYDFATFPLIRDIMAEDIRFTCPETEWDNRRETIGFLKMHRKINPRSFHAVIVDEVEIHGEEAKVTARRISPDLRTMRYICDELEQWVEGVYQYKAIKQESGWVIKEMAYRRV